MDTDINSLAFETVREVQPNIPLASKGLSISLGSKNPNIPLNVCKYSTEKTYSTRDIGTQTVRKCYSGSSTLLPDYKKTFLSPSGIEPATDVLCHDISVALPTLLSSISTVPCSRTVQRCFQLSTDFSSRMRTNRSLPF